MGSVSIIIPVYNVKPYLPQAIKSVINQTYQDLEILVIDDGSTDGSEKICDRCAGKDSRIQVIHQPKKGLSAARNTGLDLATGDFIAFLDPEMIVLGGGVSHAGEFLLEKVRNKIPRYLLYKNMPYSEIRLASLGNEAGTIGAAMIGKLAAEDRRK